jgi:hypothetical protein
MKFDEINATLAQARELRAQVIADGVRAGARFRVGTRVATVCARRRVAPVATKQLGQ